MSASLKGTMLVEPAVDAEAEAVIGAEAEAGAAAFAAGFEDTAAAVSISTRAAPT